MISIFWFSQNGTFTSLLVTNIWYTVQLVLVLPLWIGLLVVHLCGAVVNVMLRRINFYSVCIVFGLSVLLILAGSRYTDNANYRPYSENRKILKNFLKTEDGNDYLFQSFPTRPEDGSLDVNGIFERTRYKIRFELSNYNFSNANGIKKLEDLLIEEGGRPLRSLIVSTWRSGTTFLGEVLNAIPGNFYHYEPLLKYEIIQIRGPPYADEALNTLKNMFKCNFDGMEDYFEYGKTHIHQFNHNTRLWDHCKYKKELCFDSVFTSKFCKLFPFQSMKVVRVRLRLIEELLKDAELNLKVVFLVRDPRGVMQSRQHRNFCQPAPDCWQPQLLCADMVNDYTATIRLQKSYPGQLMVLRYEDLALNPKAVSYELLKFLGLSPTLAVDEFLYTHTKIEVAGVSSTYRVSRDVPFKWKYVLNFSYVDELQRVCSEAMHHWGYLKVHNATQMVSKDFNPLIQYTIE